MATGIEQGGWITLDLDQRTAVINGKNDLYQGDALANAIQIRLTKSGEVADLTGCVAEGEMVRSDGSRVPCDGNVNGDEVRIELNEHCYVYAGPYTLSVRLRAGAGQWRTILRINGEVQESGDGPIVDITESLVDVNAVLALYRDMIKVKEDAEKAISEAEQATEAANEAAKRTPYIGANGHWYIWDAESGEFVDSANPSIPALTFEAQTGAAGSQVQIEQGGTAEEPVIILTIPRGDTGAVDGVDYYEGNPSALGTASPGTANGLSRGDHVHPIPTAADVGALAANGTAANAALLGGKNPVHYVTVHNILTNSDWRLRKKIINQRGKAEYTGTSNKNTIDRWKTYGQVYVYDGYIRFANAGMEGTTYLYQNHPVGTFEAGKTYTAACMLRNGTVCVGSGVAVDGTGVTVFQSGNFLLRFHPNRNGEMDSFIIGFSTGNQSADIRWAVFCEGQHTADEVKKFVEKQYTEELLECQRWLYVASGYAAWTGYKSSTPYFFVELPTQMAGTPTVSADAISVYSTLNAGKQQSASVSTASHGTHGNKVRVTITTEETVANTQPLTCVTNNLMVSCEL